MVKPVSRETASPQQPAQLVKAVIQVALDRIDIGENVRKEIPDAEIESLAASIKVRGVLQPIKVRPAGDRWVIVWGQRRFLAARKAGLETIPAITTGEEPDGANLAIEQLVENLHRDDLNPVDRARAMRHVVDAGMSQADLARELGLAPSTVANDLGILSAPAPVLSLIVEGKLSPAHQRALKGLDPKAQTELARDVAQNGYSAHRTEELVQERKRRADVERERHEAGAAEVAREREHIATSIATELPKKKVGKDDPIVISTDRLGSPSANLILEQLRAAGYEKARLATSWNEIEARPTGGTCDCTAWKAGERTEGGRYDYNTSRSVGATYHVSVTKGCVVRKHQQAKQAATEAKRVEKEDLARKVQQHVRQIAAGVVIPATPHVPSMIAFPRILVESALWGLLSYRLPEWSVANGGNRGNAWATIHGLSDAKLADLVASEIANDFRDKAGYHIDWPTLAVDLGLVTPAGAPAPDVQLSLADAAPVDTRPQPEIGDPVVDEATHTKFRIRKLDPHAAYLAEAGPTWRKADVAVLADPARLTYDKVAGVWRGPTVPVDGLITTIPPTPAASRKELQDGINAAAAAGGLAR